MPLATIAPGEAKQLLDHGAILIDIGEADEHAREKIAEARHLPLSKLDAEELTVPGRRPVLFHCWSGARTLVNAPRLAGKLGAGCEAYIVAGGLDAWKQAGLAVVTDSRRPIELQRQVQIGAGSLALAGTLLGLLLSPWFFAVPLLVGAGLLVAGISGFCGMAHVLARMPWNRSLDQLPIG